MESTLLRKPKDVEFQAFSDFVHKTYSPDMSKVNMYDLYDFDRQGRFFSGGYHSRDEEIEKLRGLLQSIRFLIKSVSTNPLAKMYIENVLEAITDVLDGAEA